MAIPRMLATVNTLSATGKGILSLDLDSATFGAEYLTPGGLANDLNTRNAARELVVTAPGINASISGIVFEAEGMVATTGTGVPLPLVAQQQSMLTGLRINGPSQAAPGSSEEVITVAGLDSFANTAPTLGVQGISFVVWRTSITPVTLAPEYNLPSQSVTQFNMQATTNAMASALPATHRQCSVCASTALHTTFYIRSYRSTRAMQISQVLAQQNGLVPIAVIDIDTTGFNSADRMNTVTQNSLLVFFECARNAGVILEACIIATNLVRAGDSSTSPIWDSNTFANDTLTCYANSTPPAVGTRLIVDRGLDQLLTLGALSAINSQNAIPRPWTVSFFFGPTLLLDVIATQWAGLDDNTPQAQVVLLQACNWAGAASVGTFSLENSHAATAAPAVSLKAKVAPSSSTT